LYSASPVTGLFNRWLKNTDLNNPYNWDRGNLPCGNDIMILPDESPVVFIQLNTTIKELVNILYKVFFIKKEKKYSALKYVW